ncbi:Diguanylate cyclase (GGDEF) domain-containing protein (fragment) [Frankia canadensis]|uniref:Diguanylate cyclase (GGDEF) domain-containing protein n=1 Tax=Frankia canadensis TaxID=1836972 RepID=A0A2I2L0S2_9ACTN
MAMVECMRRFARLSGGMVLCIDDVQWLGPADRRVLEDLTAAADPVPLLIVASTRDPSRRLAPGCATSWDIELGPLGEDEAAEVVRGYLGEITDSAFVRDLTVRSSGNPLTMVEYLRAVIDAGLIRPDWGRYVVDRAGLDTLRLPKQVLDLIRHRVDALDRTAVAVLGTAAVLGRTFDLTLVAAVTGRSPIGVATAAARARAHQLVRDNGDGRWSFVHDCVHEALLSTMSPPERAAVHRRVVEALEANEARGDSWTYERARHAIAGGIAPAHRFRAAAEAAAAALAASAPYEAVSFYRAAQAAALEAGLEPDAEFEEGFAFACSRTIEPDDARLHFARALRTQTDRRRRARDFLALSKIDFATFRTAAALEYVHQGLAEIGRGVPANPVAAVVVCLGRWLAAFACRWPWTGFGGARGEDRELHAIRCGLYELGVESEWLGGRIGPMLAFATSALYPGRRLGSGDEYLCGRAARTMVAADFGRRRRVERDVPRLRDLADRSGDPAVQTKIMLYTSIALIILGSRGVTGERDCAEAFRRGGRWIETYYSESSYSTLVRSLALRGETRMAWEHCESRPDDEALRTDLAVLRARLAHLLGQPPVTHPDLEALAAEPAAERLRRYLICADLTDLEASGDETGAAFDAAVEAGEAVERSVGRIPRFFRHFTIVKARGRLEQARRVPPGPARERCLRVARQALRDARSAAAYPLFAAELCALRAAASELAGDYDHALRLVETAERRAHHLDAPVIRFDLLVTRARCLRGVGENERAAIEAELAMALAGHQGWLRQRARVRDEFGLTDEASRTSLFGTSRSAASRDRRRLEAVLQVSASVGRSSTPESVVAVALDEIIGILGAERAYLLLPAGGTDDAHQPLTLYAQCAADQRAADQRDVQGPPAAVPRGFATTVVERVRAEQRALVVTGTDQGAVLGSRSAVQYGLRSILAAPVPVSAGRSGVVYVDSRVAKGLFDEDDARILGALAKQVGLALHMAEAARLQTMVVSERRQRDLAEMIRDVTLQATSTLSTRGVLGRVLTAARPVLPFDAAWVLTPADDAVRIMSVHGDVAEEVAGEELRPAAGHPLIRAARQGTVLTTEDGVDLPGWSGPARSWMMIPVTLSDDIRAVVALASRTPDAYGETRVQIARTVLDQAVVGWQNAQLFERVQRLAAVDQLTGLASRRDFLEQAQRIVAAHAAIGAPLSAAMIDIDHFKRVNDTHGHFVGDEVLAEIARRMRGAFRREDVLGRLGGEEFGVLMSATEATARSLGQRLRDLVTEPVRTSAGPLDIRLSIGLATLRSSDADLRDLLTRADDALYTAKRTGRDRIVSQSDDADLSVAHEPAAATGPRVR